MANTILSLALWKHHVNLLLQSFRSVSADLRNKTSASLSNVSFEHMASYVVMLLTMVALFICFGWWDFACNIRLFLAGLVYHPVPTVPESFTFIMVLRNKGNPSSLGSPISNGWILGV